MTVLFATLGHTAAKVLAPVRTLPHVEALHVFYGYPQQPAGKSALREVEQAAKLLGIPFSSHAVEGAYDYANFLSAFVSARDVLGKDVPVVFNGSGGTDVMVMAATIFCFTNRIQLVYHDAAGAPRGITVPLHMYRAVAELGPVKQAILERLRAAGSSDMGGLASAVKVARSTLTFHVAALQEMGAVETARDGRRVVVSISREARAAVPAAGVPRASQPGE